MSGQPTSDPLFVDLTRPSMIFGVIPFISLIIEKPLDNLLTASGMIVLKNNEKMSNIIFIKNNNIMIKIYRHHCYQITER